MESVFICWNAILEGKANLNAHLERKSAFQKVLYLALKPTKTKPCNKRRSKNKNRPPKKFLWALKLGKALFGRRFFFQVRIPICFVL